MKPLNRARRAFFKKAAVTAAAVAVSGPNLGALAGQEVQASLAGVGVAGAHAASGAVPDCRPANATKVLSVLKTIGLPDWKKRRMRQWAAEGRLLDADIACLRSVSLSAKLRLQHERNYTRLERHYFEGFKDEIAREAFNKLHGTDLW